MQSFSSDNSSWFPYEIPPEKLLKDKLKKQSITEDLHYFIQHNSREELAFCYSKMMTSKKCIEDTTHERFPDFEMAFYDKELYEKQVGELFEFMIDPQEMLVIEAIYILDTMGIFLDYESRQDLYDYSMYHPNAIMCHLCRKINWKLTRRYFIDEGILECSCGKNRRLYPEVGELHPHSQTGV